MPLKICKKCQRECGVRTKICPECSSPFVYPKTNKNAQKLESKYIGQGTWVYDKVKGLPEIEVPQSLSDQMSQRDILEQIMYEGFGYCLWEHIQSEKITDKILAKKWNECYKKMNEIWQYLNKNK